MGAECSLPAHADAIVCTLPPSLEHSLLHGSAPPWSVMCFDADMHPSIARRVHVQPEVPEVNRSELNNKSVLVLVQPCLRQSHSKLRDTACIVVKE